MSARAAIVMPGLDPGIHVFTAAEAGRSLGLVYGAGWGRIAMSGTLARVQTLVLSGDFRVSDHGFDELEADAILAGDAIAGIAEAVAIEDYPDRQRGPSVLALQHDADGRPIHVVWAIPAGDRRPAVLVTAYRPDPDLWDSDFRQRKQP